MQAKDIRAGDRILSRDNAWRTVLSVGPMDGHIEVETIGGRIDLYRATDEVQRLTCSAERGPGPWDDFPERPKVVVADAPERYKRPAGKAPAEWGVR